MQPETNQPTTIPVTATMRDTITLEEYIKSTRSLMLSWESSVLSLKNHEELKGESDPQRNKGEAIENIMLAYRHMEDARMRLGKVIQAMDGGQSIYDKKA